MLAHLALLFVLPQVTLDAALKDAAGPNKKKQEEPAPRPTKDDLLRRPYDWDVEFSPDRDLYKTYLADPRQSKSGSKVQFPVRGDKEDNIKIENVLGGHRPLVGWSDDAHPEEEM